MRSRNFPLELLALQRRGQRDYTLPVWIGQALLVIVTGQRAGMWFVVAYMATMREDARAIWLDASCCSGYDTNDYEEEEAIWPGNQGRDTNGGAVRLLREL